jgi:hypothetical protein
VEGPIGAAVAEPFLLVQGTGGEVSRQARTKRYVSDIEKAWSNKHLVNIRKKLDSQITAEDINEMNLVVIGEPKGGSLIQRITKRIPLLIDKKAIEVGDFKELGEDLFIAMVYPNPANTHKCIVIINSNSNKDVAFPEPDLARYGADVAIWSLPGNEKVARLGRQLLWDNSWQHLAAAEKNEM